MAPAGDVSKVYVVLFAGIACRHLLPQVDDHRMVPELQYVVDLASRLLLYLLQRIDVPGVQHHRFFAYCISLVPEGEPDVRVVQVIGRTDAHIIELHAASLKLIDMPVEPFKLNEEVALRKVVVEFSHAVELVEAGQQPVACLLYGFKVPVGNIAGHPNESEIFRFVVHQ